MLRHFVPKFCILFFEFLELIYELITYLIINKPKKNVQIPKLEGMQTKKVDLLLY